MSSFAYNRAIKEILDRTLDITSGCKVMLVGSEYVPNRADLYVDAGGAADAVDAEIEATNYTRGWGGSGRKAATVTIVQQDSDSRIVIRLADLVWTALGGVLNDTVEGAILIKEGGADDTTSKLIAYFDLPTTPTNGTDFTMDFDGVDGNVRFSTA